MSGPRPNRRRVLAAGAALLVAGPAVLPGCTGPPAAPEPPDPLESPARRAETDSALAQAVAQLAQTAAQAGDQTHAALATASKALAEDRMAHAITLRAELRRVRPAPATSSSAPSPAPTPPLTDPDLASARAAVLQAVHSAQDEAAALVMTLPGHRAALLASVAACCATHAELLP